MLLTDFEARWPFRFDGYTWKISRTKAWVLRNHVVHLCNGALYVNKKPLDNCNMLTQILTADEFNFVKNSNKSFYYLAFAGGGARIAISRAALVWFWKIESDDGIPIIKYHAGRLKVGAV